MRLALPTIMVLLYLPSTQNASINHSEIFVSYGGKHGMNGFGSGIFCSLLILLMCNHLPLSMFLSTIQYLRLTMLITHQSLLSDLMKHIIEALPITNAAGLTVLYTQKILLLKFMYHNHISFLIVEL